MASATSVLTGGRSAASTLARWPSQAGTTPGRGRPATTRSSIPRGRSRFGRGERFPSTTVNRTPPVTSEIRLNNTAIKTVKPTGNNQYQAADRTGTKDLIRIEREALEANSSVTKVSTLSTVPNGRRDSTTSRGDQQNHPEAEVEDQRDFEHRPRLDMADESTDLAGTKTPSSAFVATSAERPGGPTGKTGGAPCCGAPPFGDAEAAAGGASAGSTNSSPVAV